MYQSRDNFDNGADIDPAKYWKDTNSYIGMYDSIQVVKSQFIVNGIFLKVRKSVVILTLSFLSKKKTYRYDSISLTGSSDIKHDKSLVGIIVALLQEKTIGFLIAAGVMNQDGGNLKFKKRSLCKCAKALNSSLRMRRKPVLGG